MKKYYIAKMIGDGSIDNPRRVKIADYHVNHTIEITGSDWALVLVDTQDHSDLLIDDDIRALPSVTLDTESVTLDTEMSSIQESDITKLKIDLSSKLGIETDFVDTQSLFGDVIRHIGKLNNIFFDELIFDVSE